MQIAPVSILSFPGLEIRQHQRRVLQNGEEINLTRLEYSTLILLASNPGIVLTQEHIFEAVWNMDISFWSVSASSANLWLSDHCFFLRSKSADRRFAISFVQVRMRFSKSSRLILLSAHSFIPVLPACEQR